MHMNIGIPRLVVAALKGGSGKTVITMGLIAALRALGLNTAVFKKGPDYIDAGWLSLAGGGECYNLDTYLFGEDVTRRSFFSRAAGKDMAVVEGNRGLLDGVDSQGTYSTAQLAELIAAPVVLIVDCTKMTRTAAALVLGCQRMAPETSIKGVILNRVGGARHEQVLRRSIEEGAGIPVIGSIKRLVDVSFPQRHLGLIPQQEHPEAVELVRRTARLIMDSVDMDRLQAIAREAMACFFDDLPRPVDNVSRPRDAGLRIGVIRDSAFQFYYPENLEALSRAAGQLVFVSALKDSEIPDLDALYIGGGFPETHSRELAANTVFKDSLLRAIESGLPVYAECGGLMYLCRNLIIDDKEYPMVGAFPVDTVLERKPKGLGYIRVEVTGPNPFYPQGKVLTGHEFHYSTVTNTDGHKDSFAFRVLRGHGMDGINDGITRHNALGTYMHVHTLGEPSWAECLAKAAASYKTRQEERIPE